MQQIELSRRSSSSVRPLKGLWVGKSLAHMESDALHQLGMVCCMQLFVSLLAWGICHAAQHTCLAVEICLRSTPLLAD